MSEPEATPQAGKTDLEHAQAMSRKAWKKVDKLEEEHAVLKQRCLDRVDEIAALRERVAELEKGSEVEQGIRREWARRADAAEADLETCRKHDDSVCATLEERTKQRDKAEARVATLEAALREIAAATASERTRPRESSAGEDTEKAYERTRVRLGFPPATSPDKQTQTRCFASFREGPRWDIPGQCELPVGHHGPHSDHAHNILAPPATSSAGEPDVVTFREHAIRAAAREPELLAEIEQLKLSGDMWMIAESREEARADAAEVRVATLEAAIRAWRDGEVASMDAELPDDDALKAYGAACERLRAIALEETR